jgi:murein DD-endopeptidase MepM/ murein hydrolase activator NlpD
VETGDTVAAGQSVARCGNTGNTGNLPHLHFEVFRGRAYSYSDAIPIAFRNARGPSDAKGGMVAGTSYEALGEAP